MDSQEMCIATIPLVIVAWALESLLVWFPEACPKTRAWAQRMRLVE